MYPANLSFSNCTKGPAQGGLPVAELKELAKKMGINSKLTKAEICNEMAKIFNSSTSATPAKPVSPVKATKPVSPAKPTPTSTAKPVSPVKATSSKPVSPAKPTPTPTSTAKPISPAKVAPAKPTSTAKPASQTKPTSSKNEEKAKQLDIELQGKGLSKVVKSTDAQGLVDAIAYHINKYDKLPPYFWTVMNNFLGASYYKNIDPLRVKLGLLEAIVKSGKADKNPQNKDDLEYLSKYPYLSLITISYPVERPRELPIPDYIYYYNVINNLIEWADLNDSKELSEKIKSEFGVPHIFINAVNNSDLKTMKEVMKLYPPTEKDFIEALNQVAYRRIMGQDRNDLLSVLMNMVKPDYLVKAMASMKPVDYVLILEAIDPKLAEDITLSLFMYFAEHNLGTKRANMEKPISLDNLNDILSLYKNILEKTFVDSDKFKKGIDAARDLADKNGFTDVKKSFDFIILAEAEFKASKSKPSSGPSFSSSDSNRNQRPLNFSADKCGDCIKYFTEAGLWTNKNIKLTLDDRKELNKAFLKWARLNHPDKGGDTEMFAKISACRDYYNDNLC